LLPVDRQETFFCCFEIWTPVSQMTQQRSVHYSTSSWSFSFECWCNYIAVVNMYFIEVAMRMSTQNWFLISTIKWINTIRIF
jgi:hypothetical protein